MDEASWCDFISSAARHSLEKSQFNKETLLPTVADVSLLYQHAKEEGERAKACNDYQAMAKTTMCELLLFNRKRAGEVQRLKKAQFEKRKQTKEIDPDIEKSLSNVEQHLVQSLTRIEVRGKFGRKTAILLTGGVMEKIEHLLALQTRMGGKASASQYVFATPDGDRPYRTCDVIRNLSLEAGVKNPAMFRSTNLRKLIATLTQCLELTEGDQDLLAEFLGHDIRIHRKYYRMPMDILQKSKVAKILLAANGQLQKDDTAVDDGDDSEGNTAQQTYIMDDVDDRHEEEQSNVATQSDQNSSSRQQVCKRNACSREKWQKEEIDAIRTHFEFCFKLLRAPHKDEVERVKDIEPALSNRTWRNIKDYISYRIRSMKR